MDKEIPISVVVCCQNRESTIEQCLKSIKRNNPKEIIIVDGRSSDNTVKIAKKYTKNILYENGEGLAHARQIGAEKVTTKYLAYIDSDVIIAKDFLENLFKELKKYGWDGIHAQIIGDKAKNYWEWAENQQFKINFNKVGERHRIGTIACIFLTKAIQEEKFDTFFNGAYEDGELCLRLIKKGYKLGVGKTTAIHQHRANFGNFKKQKIWYGRGGMRMVWKYKNPKYLVAPFFYIFYGSFLALKNKQPKIVPYYFFNWFFFTIGMVKEFFVLLRNH